MDVLNADRLHALKEEHGGKATAGDFVNDILLSFLVMPTGPRRFGLSDLGNSCQGLRVFSSTV